MWKTPHLQIMFVAQPLVFHVFSTSTLAYPRLDAKKRNITQKSMEMLVQPRFLQDLFPLFCASGALGLRGEPQIHTAHEMLVNSIDVGEVYQLLSHELFNQISILIHLEKVFVLLQYQFLLLGPVVSYEPINSYRSRLVSQYIIGYLLLHGYKYILKPYYLLLIIPYEFSSIKSNPSWFFEIAMIPINPYKFL